MAYGIVLEFTDVEVKQYDAVNEKLGLDMSKRHGRLARGPAQPRRRSDSRADGS